MRILLVAEGEHELHGALSRLVLRTLDSSLAPVEFEVRQMADASIRGSHGKGPRLVKRVLAWMREASRIGCSTLILVIDEDGDRDRRGQIDIAQETTAYPLKRAIGIAIRTFDAWMLADETAITVALGKETLCQPAPEEIANPKEHFAALHRDAGCTVSTKEAYDRVAQHARLNVLASRCAHGFAPFVDRLRQLRD